MNYRRTVLSDSPLAYWRLAAPEGGAIVNDSSGNGHHGLFIGGVTLNTSGATTDGDPCFAFNGSTGYVTVPSFAGLVSDLTAELWVYATSLASRFTVLTKHYTREMELTVETTGSVSFYFGDGAAYTGYPSDTGLIELNTWIHVAVVRDLTANTVTFYKNGAQFGAAVSITGPDPAAGSNPVLIGVSAGAGAQFTPGRLDEVVLYGRVLSGTEIAEHYTAATVTEAGPVQVYVNGADVTRNVDKQSIRVSESLFHRVDTAAFRMRGVYPTEGQTVQIENDFGRYFTGTILNRAQKQDHQAQRVWHPVNCIDNSRLMNRQLVFKAYTSWRVDSIAHDLVTNYSSGFTKTGIQAINSVVGRIEFTAVPLARALTRLAQRIGAQWKLDAYDDVQFGNLAGGSQPALDDAATHFWDFDYSKDLSQVRTRVYVEGMGTPLKVLVSAGETILPVDTATIFDPEGGQAIIAGQRLTYGGIQEGGAGALAGPGVTPTNAPTAAPRAVGSINAGAHQYAYTWVTASGETRPSPLLNVTVPGTVTAPSTAPTGAEASGTGNLAITVNPAVASPQAPSASNSAIGGELVIGATYRYKYTYVTATGETLAGPASAAASTTSGSLNVYMVFSSDPAVTTIRIYRTTANGSTYLRHPYEITNILNGGSHSIVDGGGGTGDAYLGVAEPSSNTTLTADSAYKYKYAYGVDDTASAHTYETTPSNESAAITTRTGRITVSAPAGATGARWVRFYRTAANGSTFRYVGVATLPSLSFTDTLSDASIASNPTPVGSNTALSQTLALSAIGVGPSSVTQRKVYRTLADASQLKLLTTLANNTATTYTDSSPDSSLGANAPVTDTSGLPAPSGQVKPGDTSFYVSGLVAFSESGGWVTTAGGQVLRYSSISAGQLMGVPASGVGAVTAAFNYGTTVIAVPAVTSVPASGAGALVEDLSKSDEDLHLVVQADDTAAQAVLAALEGGDGIHEYWIQDRRLNATSAQERGDAELLLFASPEHAGSYKTRSESVVTGQVAVINLTSPTAISSVTVMQQQITYSEFHDRLGPIRTVEFSTHYRDFFDVIGELEEGNLE